MNKYTKSKPVKIKLCATKATPKRKPIVKKAKPGKATKAKKVVKKVVPKMPPAKVVTKERPVIQLNVPLTKEQQAGVPSVVRGNLFEGALDISKMELKDQIDTVFNPLHAITKTTVTDA